MISTDPVVDSTAGELGESTLVDRANHLSGSFEALEEHSLKAAAVCVNTRDVLRAKYESWLSP